MQQPNSQYISQKLCTPPQLPDVRLKNYEISDHIGCGGFSDIFKIIKNDKSSLAALKIDKNQKLLENEHMILKKLQNIHNIPRIIEKQNDGLIMELLGKNLEYYKEYFNHLSLKTTLILGVQMIQTLKEIHDQGIIHRDIKPENICLGVYNQKHTFYLVDFGLSKFYIKDNKHIDFKQNNEIIGTPRYWSSNSHEGFEQSRRDDLESLAYILIYLNTGSLPWQTIGKASNKKIRNMKEQILDNEQINETLINFLKQIRQLKFTDRPDYDEYIHFFSNVIQEQHLSLIQKKQYCFDWCKFNCGEVNSSEQLIKNSLSSSLKSKQSTEDCFWEEFDENNSTYKPHKQSIKVVG